MVEVARLCVELQLVPLLRLVGLERLRLQLLLKPLLLHCLDIGLNPRLVNCQRFTGRVFFRGWSHPLVAGLVPYIFQ